MLLVNGITWGTLLLGLLLSVMLGRRVKSSGGAIGLSVAVGVVLLLVVNFGLAGCAELKLCPHLGDTGLTYALSPLFSVPVYWLVARASRQGSGGAKEKQE